MEKGKLENRIADIIHQPVRILNATVGKSYEARLDMKKLKWSDISDFHFDQMEQTGLAFDEQTQQITGIPVQSGDVSITFKFKMEGEPDDAPYHEKPISLIVNPDPKTLWKKLESNRADPYWKEDDVTVLAPIAGRYFLASSKRGRSHANTGSFREDDFAFKEFDTGWNLVVVADGAGSAKLSRKGSALACQALMDYFTQNATEEDPAEFEELLKLYQSNTDDDTQKKLNHYVYNKLGKAAFWVHKQLEEFAAKGSIPLKDLNTTFIFTLFRHYDGIGWAFLSFGVGDCPIAVLNPDVSEVTLMNWLDVGDFGGGTRFITMPEIFQHEKFATRFGFKLIDDFSYLMMMTDGIYDAKFVVESNLADPEKWKEFLADLQGKNEDRIGISFKAADENMVPHFSAWMDFWSPGNHDDRTLAIVFKSES